MLDKSFLLIFQHPRQAGLCGKALIVEAYMYKSIILATIRYRDGDQIIVVWSIRIS